jgi:hypothetical protein
VIPPGCGKELVHGRSIRPCGQSAKWLLDLGAVYLRPPRLDLVTSEQMARRIRTALDMYELGERMALSRLRRCHPEATDEQIAFMLREWRLARPGAPDGDAVGRPSHRFE